MFEQDENLPPTDGPSRNLFTPPGQISPSKQHLHSRQSYDQQVAIPIAPIALTKESLLGRRAYSKVVDRVCQENLSQTAEAGKREALARLATAWQVLDRVDPEGEFLFLKSLIENLREEPKLAAALGLTEQTGTGTSIIHSQQSANSSFGSAVTKVDTPVSSIFESHPLLSSPGKTQVTAYNIPASPHKSPAKTSMLPPAPPAKGGPHRRSESVDVVGLGAGGSPSKLPPRLVLAQSNPHLKSHRRRQSAIVGGAIDAMRLEAVEERRLPGHVEQGMEAQAGITDVLYGRWVEGLKSRWGMA
jgi:serine/threonine-protein kinase 24/25/MST4